jgi:hypothetical protein
MTIRQGAESQQRVVEERKLPPGSFADPTVGPDPVRKAARAPAML